MNCSQFDRLDVPSTIQYLTGQHIPGTYGTNDVGHVGDGGTGGSTKVENLGAWLDVNSLDTTKNGGSQLGAEGVPHAVLNLALARLNTRVKARPNRESGIEAKSETECGQSQQVQGKVSRQSR